MWGGQACWEITANSSRDSAQMKTARFVLLIIFSSYLTKSLFFFSRKHIETPVPKTVVWNTLAQVLPSSMSVLQCSRKAPDLIFRLKKTHCSSPLGKDKTEVLLPSVVPGLRCLSLPPCLLLTVGCTLEPSANTTFSFKLLLITVF